MRTAETVLNVIRNRGERGLPLEAIYRQLYNRNLYRRAYGRLYRNAGAMTRGTTEETVDGMSLAKIDAIIEALRFERYRWTPVRRVHIPKSNGQTRPLGIPTWSDKLLQEVIRMILDAYYEPQFSNRSHGFRPERGCHTALSECEIAAGLADVRLGEPHRGDCGHVRDAERASLRQHNADRQGLRIAAAGAQRERGHHHEQ